MWNVITEQLWNGRALKVAARFDSAPVSYAQVIRHWQTDEVFRKFFVALLAEAPFTAFRWETPPVTAGSVSRAFEFVLLDSPELARAPDPEPFVMHFRNAADARVVSFPNLGHDATLVVPCPLGGHEAYAHLAAFVRRAPEPQVHSLWQRVGSTMEQSLGPASLWLSTAGAGVPWVHVRLDSRPKY